MSQTQENFSSKFKADLVIEVIKGDRDINTIAAEHGIQPDLLLSWKKEFLEKAPSVFDRSREEHFRKKAALLEKESDEYVKKIDEATIQLDWVKKKLQSCLDQGTRLNLVRDLLKNKEEISITAAAEILGINRTSVYYKKRPVSEEELQCKAIVERLHAENPTWGARRISAQLKMLGHNVGRKRAHRYLTEMETDCIDP